MPPRKWKKHKNFTGFFVISEPALANAGCAPITGPVHRPTTNPRLPRRGQPSRAPIHASGHLIQPARRAWTPISNLPAFTRKPGPHTPHHAPTPHKGHGQGTGTQGSRGRAAGSATRPCSCGSFSAKLFHKRLTTPGGKTHGWRSEREFAPLLRQSAMGVTPRPEHEDGCRWRNQGGVSLLKFGKQPPNGAQQEVRWRIPTRGRAGARVGQTSGPARAYTTVDPPSRAGRSTIGPSSGPDAAHSDAGTRGTPRCRVREEVAGPAWGPSPTSRSSTADIRHRVVRGAASGKRTSAFGLVYSGNRRAHSGAPTSCGGNGRPGPACQTPGRHSQNSVISGRRPRTAAAGMVSFKAGFGRGIRRHFAGPAASSRGRAENENFHAGSASGGCSNPACPSHAPDLWNRRVQGRTDPHQWS